MTALLWFIGGLFAGGFLGFFIAACCAAASDGRRWVETGPHHRRRSV